ncbi:hypothetical protein [Phaeodactylibacter xiamenensis]|uniref:hypothetical protein n=1 Tax=Phaeodactylibacter xiamenensis TaxID=1524460 RepID=UPI003CCB8688
MKKSILLFLVVATVNTALFSQLHPVPFYCKPKKDHKTQCGISKARTYAAIINTDIGKEELIKITKSYFLQEELIDSSDLELTNFDENISEYSLPVMFRQSVFFGPGMMGAKLYKTPVKLYFDTRLVFNKEGQILMNFENFHEESFTMVKANNMINIEPDPVLEPILMAAMAAEPGVVLKALVFMNGGIDALKEMKENRVNFRKELNENFEVYEQLVREGKARWLTDKDLQNYSHPSNKYFNSIIQKNIEDQKLISVDNNRWEEYFEPNFLYFFSEISSLVGGEIEAIAIDGEEVK